MLGLTIPPSVAEKEVTEVDEPVVTVGGAAGVLNVLSPP